MKNLKHIKFTEEEGVAIITIDRPKVNGLTPEAVADLR